MAGSSDDESTYNKAQRMQSGLYGSSLGGSGLSYGERYRRNPDGSYGTQFSSRWNPGVGNVPDRLLQQALSAGNGWFASWAEGFLSGYGKVRFSFRINEDGEVTGAGDFLLPLYDSEFTSVFTQLGLRTMTDERVVGNFGLGQRFFPAPNFAFGYNIFLDQDFSREHTRGGAGIEAWYDWLRLSANYYTPLSAWKGSKDYDSRLVEERPAEGYDARLTGYLPFYRNLAVTGAFEQWKGDRVGTFGGGGDLQRDPKVWSYGLEWTPVPIISTSFSQRHSGGQKETQFALTFNYMFDMPWEDQISADTVAEMRTVDGSRHDFVDRQSEMILAYQAKDAYNIIYVAKVASNTFQFRLLDGFGQVKSNKAVRVEAEYASFAGGASTAHFTTDRNGEFIVFLNTVTATPVFLTITAGQTTQRFAVDADITKPEAVVPPPAPPVVLPDAYTMEADTKTLVKNIPTQVIFTFKQGDTPVAANTFVTFIANSDLMGLPVNATTTDASGQVTVTSLTGAIIGTYEVKAEIEGETMSVDIGVIEPDTYTLEADPDELIQNKAKDVIFTFRQGDTTVPLNTTVRFSTPNEAFTGLPGTELTTDAGGKVKVENLTATKIGEQIVKATIDGKEVEVPITVAEPVPYIMVATPPTLIEGIATEVVFAFTQGGTPAAEDMPVLFDNHAAFTGLPPSDAKTDAEGKVTATGLTGITVDTYELEATIDGQTVKVAIDVKPPPLGLGFKITGEKQNFKTRDTNYQSTIDVALEYNDGSGPKALPAGTHVVWAVKTVKNPDKPWWLRSADARNGLTWGANADGTSSWAANAVEGILPIVSAIKLTDVVGSRQVTLTAAVCIDGNINAANAAACTTSGGTWHTSEKTVTFGDGPLSVFNTNPQDGVNVLWATSAGAKDTLTFDETGLDSTNQVAGDPALGAAGQTPFGDFAAPGVTFPAITLSKGTPPSNQGFIYGKGTNPGNATIVWTAQFPASGWEPTGRTVTGYRYPTYYAVDSRLPRVEDLLAVTRFSANAGAYLDSTVPRKGAALAAGWPLGASDTCYLSGEVYFDGRLDLTGWFNTQCVRLDVRDNPSSNIARSLNHTHDSFTVGVK